MELKFNEISLSLNLNEKEISLNFNSIYLILQPALYSFIKWYISCDLKMA